MFQRINRKFNNICTNKRHKSAKLHHNKTPGCPNSQEDNTKSKCKCLNAYKALQKYVDKSSKAIKHFNKRIIPTLRTGLHKN